MQKLLGTGLRDDAIGLLQVTDIIVEILVNGWWIISVEDCMTNDHGHGYYLELTRNGRKMSMDETGFLTKDDTIDAMFVPHWFLVQRYLAWNIEHFKDRTPDTEPDRAVEAGLSFAKWAGIDDPNAPTVTTANASAPKPAEVTQEHQDDIDLTQAFAACNCGCNSSRWIHHKRLSAERSHCVFYREGLRIQRRKERVARLLKPI